MGRLSETRLVVWIAACALLALAACDNSPPKVDGPGGTGGSGGISILPPTGGSGGGGAGGDGGDGGGGGEEPAAFELRSVQPPRGSVDGGTRVILKGVGFVQSVPGERAGESTQVFFDDNPALDTRVVDDQTIFATSPTGLEGDATIVVRNSSGEIRCEGCFRFLPRLNLRALEPSAGPLAGGTPIALLGDGLSEDLVVTFGGKAALRPSLQEDGNLVVILPPGDSEAPVDVRVFGEAGQSLLRRAFTYRDPLSIEAVEPPGAVSAGGTPLTVRGRGFSPTTRVRIDGVEAETIVQGDTLLVTAPPGSPGPAVLEASDAAGTARFPFAYYDPASTAVELYAVAPGSGPAAGGGAVALVGSGFDPQTMAVYFGDVVAPAVDVEHEHLAWATVPPGPLGPVDVRVRTVDGVATLPEAYRYTRAPTLLGVTPGVGPTTGDTDIQLDGANFPQEVRVFVGALEATEVRRVDGTRIEATTPEGTEGAVPVRVVDAHDPSAAAELPDAFTYEGPLSLSLVDPATGSRSGGTRVFLRGTGFRGTLEVYFGESPASDVEVIDPFTLAAVTPRGDDGLVDVRVVREDGSEARVASAFGYYNPASGNGGSSGGPLAGTLNVTAIAATGQRAGAPIPNCDVYVGSDETARLHETTDNRGQATFSGPSLVKAVSVTAFCEDYEAATVVNQTSENVTFLLSYNGVPPQDPPDEGDPEFPPFGIAGGRVWGFKAPASRSLGPNEQEVAFVGVAYPHIYAAPPIFGAPYGMAELYEEGATFAFSFVGPAHFTFYSVYGIRDTTTGSFEPLLFGYQRGVALAPGEENFDVDIILDTRMDLDVPVTILNPTQGLANRVEVSAFLDLGPNGVIPLGTAWNDVHPSQALLRNMPNVSGESMIFQAVGNTFGPPDEENSFVPPYSLVFKRHFGDLRGGITVGPLQGLPFVTPRGSLFFGDFRWSLEASPAQPDVISIEIWEPPPPGERAIPQWQIVLPGDETEVSLPPAVLDHLRAKYGGQVLGVTFITGIQPTFDFDQWNYQSISLGNFTSFTFDQFGIRP